MRKVQMYGVDLGLYQFQAQLTWAAMFLNADGTIYGRYGSRGARRGMKDNDKDISLEGFKKSMRGALELHRGYPGNGAALAGKRGPAPLAESPEKLPAAPPDEAKPAGPGRHGCIHCHQVQDWEVMSLWKASRPVPDRLLFPYPMPEALGLTLDPRERAAVAAVAEGSAARRAGFEAGDAIVTLAGQPVISIADVQWVLHQASEPSTVKAEVDRKGKRVALDLPVPEGWRLSMDFADTLSLGWTVRMFIAGMRCRELPGNEKLRLGIQEDALALSIREITPEFVKGRNNSARAIGLKKEDVIIAVDDRKAAMTESQFLRYLVQEKKPGQKVDLTFLRGKESRKVQLELPLARS